MFQEYWWLMLTDLFEIILESFFPGVGMKHRVLTQVPQSSLTCAGQIILPSSYWEPSRPEPPRWMFCHR